MAKKSYLKSTFNFLSEDDLKFLSKKLQSVFFINLKFTTSFKLSQLFIPIIILSKLYSGDCLYLLICIQISGTINLGDNIIFIGDKYNQTNV